VVNPTADLLFASQEGKELDKLFQPASQLLVEGKATREAVLREAPERTYLHFACHGSYGWRDVMRSALVLAGGYHFRLPEIASQLDLDATRLVTLSACETALIEFEQTPDEYIGLPAAFLQRGVPEVVSSLWAVDDLSTALLMMQFYDYHLKRDFSISQSLRAAQRWLRHEVDGPTVIEHINSLLGELEDQLKGLPTYSEAADALGRRIHRIKWRRDALLKREAHDPGGHPFDHPYYWAAFTVWGPNVDATEKNHNV
jgi:CHAT domain-containing protein